MSSRVELEETGAPTPAAEDQTPAAVNQTPENSKQKGDRELLLVVIIFIATASFQAGTNPPGGVWQDDKDPRYEAGKSIMASKHPSQFVSYIAGVTTAMIVSTTQVLVMMNDLPYHNYKLPLSRIFLYCSMGLAFSGLGLAYWSSVTALTPKLQLRQVTTALISNLVFGFVIIFIILLIQKCRSMCKCIR